MHDERASKQTNIEKLLLSASLPYIESSFLALTFVIAAEADILFTRKFRRRTISLKAEHNSTDSEICCSGNNSNLRNV